MIPKYIQLKNKIGEDILLKKYPLFSKLPTEVELAKSYNVSRATVRQALDLLQQDGIIEKKWGSGNVVVGTFDQSKKSTVAFIIPKINTAGYKQILDELRAGLYKEKLDVVLFETDNSQQREREILLNILNDMYGGVIIKPAASALPSMNLDLYHKLLKRKQPLLFLGTAPYSLQNVPLVSGNDYDCGYMCARHFINKGHKNIGGIFSCDDAVSVSRFWGYVDAMRDANIPFSEDNVYWVYSHNAAISSFLKSNLSNMSALICNDEIVTGKVLDYCNKNNLTLPADLSLICCQDTITPGTTSVSVSCMALSKPLEKEIIRAILAIKKNGNLESISIPYKLIQRESS